MIYNYLVYEANKSLGQNFLLDPMIAEKLIDLLNVASGDVVVEIGAGLGALTQRLADKMDYTDFTAYALEIDSRFIPKLQAMFVTRQKLFVEETDVLKWLPEFETEKPLKILGALPFYITSPIIHTIVKMKVRPQTVVLVVQKEVGQKLARSAPDSSYLSVFVQTFFNVEYVGDIPRDQFDPKPNVDGGILLLTKRADADSTTDLRKYEGFLHRGFANPRKMLNKAFSKEDLTNAGIDPTLRPEALDCDRWFAFYRHMQSHGDGLQ
ncbi:ribosomal RNA small subunit methyltransferase A [candidate division WWE3 bacterium RIFOXYC1_FULL_39_7]|uniref:Ribosomal RNA small subunit methyltransferase A n=2 Tax=Katanobacteria TaxID=422282 RepID=A0A1F4X7G0_UNCKA|nr:MAG: ribosomal RNA small subunit methyltransferase A [candidate division WWE3 bacterium RIFOXYC1_FULL_39_7]OGC77650.1 MAG: ribosomal RNA small subunit methyltransferase A [candidate division WWE3 bacterium RIFOXYD1_FULL_39_9]